MGQEVSISHAYCKQNYLSRMLVYDPQKIVALREGKGWRQAELARRSELSQPTVWSLEHGRTKMPKFETLEAISRALGVPVEQILPDRPRGKRGEQDWRKEILAAFEALDEGNQATLRAIAQTLLNGQKRK